MMPTCTSSTRLGRQLWGSAWEAVDTLLGRLPGRQQHPLSRSKVHAEAFPQSRPSFRISSSTWRPSHSHRTLPNHAAGSGFAPVNVRRSCTSGSLLLLGLSSPSSSTQAAVTSCTAAAADSALSSKAAGSKSTVARPAWQSWMRSMHTGRGSRAESRTGDQSPVQEGGRTSTRPQSSVSDGEERKRAATGTSRDASPEAKPEPPAMPPPQGEESLSGSVSKYLHLPHLPKMPHRPTKEELLAAATGFWQRLKVRFKWLSIRSMRPYNADEWGAFLSWLMLGHIVWILVGTTTFFSLVILTVNTVFAQETLAKRVGDYLTRSAGVTVVFESAIVPRWKDGVITFRNVFVSRRPGQVRSSVMKGSSSNAAAVAAARKVHSDGSAAAEEEDGNYTQFDVTINTVNVTLSFLKWWNGTGLLKDVEVKGVRGVVDRTSVHWADGQPTDPLSYRHVHQPGDFEIEHFKLEDLLVTVHQPGGFRPFPVSIYSCELPQLRKRWLFHDLLSATHMSGSIDGSLFTIHPRQVHGMAAGDGHDADTLGGPGAWKKFSRIRIDGLKIDHLNRGVEGPFGWIYEGNVDIVADLMFPADPDGSIGKVVSDFYDKMEEAVTSNRYIRILDREAEKIRTLAMSPQSSGMPSEGFASRLSRDPTDVVVQDQLQVQVQEQQQQKRHLTVDSVDSPSSSSSSPDTATAVTDPATPPPSPSQSSSSGDETPPQRYIVMDLRLHLNDVRAAVPLFTHDISYISQPLVRPIVAYINAKRTYIPISCRIVKRISDLDGSWTVYDCGLLDDMSAQVYDAFARDVEDQHSRVRRLKKVGFWTLSMVVHALLAGVAGDLI